MEPNQARPFVARNVFIDDYRTYSSELRRHYVIDLLRPENMEENITFVKREMLENDPIIRGLGIHNDRTSIDSLQRLVTWYLRHNVALGCYYLPEGNVPEAKDPPVLVGVDLLHIRRRRDKFFEENSSQGEKFSELMNYLGIVYRAIWDIRPLRQVTKYLSSFGIVITPEHEHITLRENIISMQRDIASSRRIQFVVSPFVTESMQKSAKSKRFFKYNTITENNIRFCGLTINHDSIKYPILIRGTQVKNDDESD